MKKFILLLSIFFCSANIYCQSYKITLTAPQYQSGIAYLTYYYGSSLNIADSAAVSNTGIAIFKGDKKLQAGIYVIVFPGKRLRTEFLIDKEQTIFVKADTTDLLNKTVVTGSKENDLYAQYQKYVAQKGRQLEDEKRAFTSSTTKADSLLHEKNFTQYNKDLFSYRENIIKTQPNSMMAALLNAMKEPSVPKAKPITRQDSISNYFFYKNHYWDGVSFMDDRIIRSPFFLTRLEHYYNEVLPQASDSITKDLDYKLLLARSCPEMYKFLLNWSTDEYINPKYMGQDAVFVHLFENYHSKGLSNWLNQKQMDIINRRAYMLMANLVGEIGSNLEMIDTSDKPSSLYDVKAAYTIVCFWDPNCGHCKLEMPRLDSIYQASWKNHDLKIYAVLTPDDKENVKPEWIKFINEHHLTSWINVYKPKAMEDADIAAQKPSFRQSYDVELTPTIYLLDKDKKIVAKKLSILQLNELLEVKWKNKN